MADWGTLLPGALKCKLICLRHGRTVVALLGVVGVLLLGCGAYAGLAPGTEMVTEERAAQTVSADTNVSAVVGPNSSLWAPGTRLENRPAYILQDSPEATVNASVGVSDGELTDADPAFTLEYRAVRDGETIWRESRPLAAAVEHDANGLTAVTTVNVSTVAERIDARKEAVGRAAKVRASIVFEIPYETRRYDGTLRTEFPITVDGAAYELDPASASETRTTTTQVERPADPNVPLTAALLLIGAVALVGSGGAYRVTRGSSAADLPALEREIEHARYAEWISRGEFPTGVDREYVRLESVDDLVNLAIDANSRVVYDQERDAYAVVTSDVVYYVGDRAAVVPEWQFGAVPNVAEQER